MVTDYTLHGKNVVHMTHGCDELHFFYDAQNRPAVVVYNGTAYAYVKNLQGDVIAILDEAGNFVVSYMYDAWGQPISKNEALAETLGALNPFRYRGYVFDEETGLYYLQERFFSCYYNRFLNCDIILTTSHYSINVSAYAYCANNPINKLDPSGRFYVALELYAIAMIAENNEDFDFSGTLLAAKMTERISHSKLIKERVVDYIKAIPEGENSYSATDSFYWGFRESIDALSMADLDLALAVGHTSSLTITVEKADKGFIESIFYGGEKYKVTYSVRDYYDFEEWEGSDRDEVLIWINDTFGYDLQKSETLHNYWYTITGEYYVYAY